MVRHTQLHRRPKVYEEFYCNQTGHGFPVFMGGRSQRGRGIGSFFSGLGRTILPWLKTGGKALLREGIGTGLQVAQDALAGRHVGESFKEHAKEAGQRLLTGAAEHLQGPGQSGSGYRRRPRKRAAPPGEPFKSQHSRAKRAHFQKKKKHSDIFG